MSRRVEDVAVDNQGTVGLHLPRFGIALIDIALAEK